MLAASALSRRKVQSGGFVGEENGTGDWKGLSEGHSIKSGSKLHCVRIIL